MNQQEFFVADPIFPCPPTDAGPSAIYLRALVENSPIAIVVLNAQHRYVMCNPAFERLFQYTPKQLSSADLDDLIAGPEMAEEAAQLTRSVMQGQNVHMVAQRRRRDGMMVDVEIHGIPLTLKGRLAGVYALYQDVTERNEAQTAFRQISNQLENLQQEERRRLARDLHDSTSQELAALNWNLARIIGLVGDRDEALRRLVRETKDLATLCSARIRSASYLLHPPLLGKAGLTLAIPWMVENFEQRSGIRVALYVSDSLGRFRDEIEIAIYRVAQECLANVLRHSGSAEAQVTLSRKDAWLQLSVNDSGTNQAGQLLMHSYNSRSGVGISGMRERVEELGGCLGIDCSATGTSVTAAIPLETGP
jgi:two-component system, NarL family, sensor kinase